VSDFISYVLGFVFDEGCRRVVLISKKRPQWMLGRLNGVGGKIEPGEKALAAMVRECEEETGLRVEDWSHVATIRHPTFKIVCFFTVADVTAARTMTDEEVRIVHLSRLHELLEGGWLLPNLPLLIALSLDRSGIRKPVELLDDSAVPQVRRRLSLAGD
jgi:8-oxo-dGTP pyrophosphatase MutT (NUDIX family)